MTEDEMLEEVAGAWRPTPLRSHEEIRSHPLWYDLQEEGRVDAARRAMKQRIIEAAFDERGLSTTARSVLSRIRETNS